MGKTLFMTGATSGFGQIIALDAAKKGNVVVVLARSLEKANLLIETFNAQNTNSSGRIEIIEGDLSSFKSLIKACNQFKQQYKRVNVIIHNAGIMNFKHRKSEDGIEETLQVNLLSPMLINHLLYEHIVKDKNAKIIITASALHQGTINFENIEFNETFSSFKTYRQSKLGVILMCRLLSQSLLKDQIGIYSVHPGLVRTELGREAGWFSKLFFWVMGKSIEKGAETHLHLLNESNTNLTTGEYYANSKIKAITKESNDLELANQLHQLIRQYLEPYISSATIIFQ